MEIPIGRLLLLTAAAALAWGALAAFDSTGTVADLLSLSQPGNSMRPRSKPSPPPTTTTVSATTTTAPQTTKPPAKSTTTAVPSASTTPAPASTTQAPARTTPKPTTTHAPTTTTRATAAPSVPPPAASTAPTTTATAPDTSLASVWKTLQFAPLIAGRHRLAVIVPFRDGCTRFNQGAGRTENLEEFIPAMHAFLTARGLDFRIIVVEQPKKGLFNKSLMMNIGFLLAREHFDYFVFHDVDMVPIEPSNTYGYPGAVPVHRTIAWSANNFRAMLPESAGGALTFSREQFEAVNGYSISYWGWGLEDDDIYYRVLGVFGRIERLDESVGRYRSLFHPRVFGLDELPVHVSRRGELQRLRQLVASGDKSAVRATIAASGVRQVQFGVAHAAHHATHDRVLIDFIFPRPPNDDCE